MNFLVSVFLGLGLSACCGFRVFVPLLVANVATRLGYLPVEPGFEWTTSWVTLAVLSVATISEIAAYYIPWLDHLLDTIALPAAFIAGTVLTTSLLGEGSPVLRWGLGLIVGGGSAGVIQAGTSLLRLGSTATTGGLGNPVVATFENGMALLFSILTFWIPLIVGGLALVLVFFLLRRLLRPKRTSQ